MPGNKDQSQTRDYVRLQPPLAFRHDGALAGVVEGLAPDALMVELARPLEPTLSPIALEVLTPGGSSVHLRTSREDSSAPSRHAVFVVAAADRPALDNLLALIRKDQHIKLCQEHDVEASDRYTGFEELSFLPCALPDLAWSQLDLRRRFLGREFAAPLLITGMTGGVERGAEINRRLALAAQHFGIPMGVGSQRLALENPAHAAIFAVKKWAPRLFVIANIGAAQLGRSIDREACLRAVDMIEADALAVHLNILQEVVQVEGDRDFRGLFAEIAALAQSLPVPLIVKEVGAGIDPQSARRLLDAGVAAVDVGGKGGTSWSHIEGLRASSPITRDVAGTFRDFGIPTAQALAAVRHLCPQAELVATGGLRDGLTVAKAVALGATMAGVGLPLFRAALTSDEAPLTAIETLLKGLKTAMICTGCQTLAELSARLSFGHPLQSALKEHVATLSHGREGAIRHGTT